MFGGSALIKVNVYLRVERHQEPGRGQEPVYRSPQAPSSTSSYPGKALCKETAHGLPGDHLGQY